MDLNTRTAVLASLVRRQRLEWENVFAICDEILPGHSRLYLRECGPNFHDHLDSRKTALLAERLAAPDMPEPLLRPEDFKEVTDTFASRQAAQADTEEHYVFAKHAWQLDAMAAVASLLIEERPAYVWQRLLTAVEKTASRHGLAAAEVVADDELLDEVWRTAFTAAEYRAIRYRQAETATNPDAQVDRIFIPVYRGIAANLGMPVPPDDPGYRMIRDAFKQEIAPLLLVELVIRQGLIEEDTKRIWG